MNNASAVDILARGLRKYGELATAGNNIEKILKKHCITDRICVKNVNRMRLIEAITLHGAILEENINEQSCVAVVNTGKMNAVRALVAIVLKKDAVQFAAYAKEGLIKQGLAQGAIEKIKKELT